MSKRISLYPFVVFLVLYVSLFGVISDASAAAKEEFHKTYKVKDGTHLSVQNTNGRITVSAWDKDYVDVLAVKKTKKDEDELAKVEIEVSTNGRLSIETLYIEKNARVSVDYTIKVPENVLVEQVKTTSGSVELSDTRGDTSLKSTNGALRVEDADGFINAQTTNGDITITGTTGIKQVKSTNGSIDVSFLKLSDDVDITTTNGSIELHIPENMNADIELKTSNGRIKGGQIWILIDEISKNNIKGKIGSGGNRLNVKTTNGNIALYKL